MSAAAADDATEKVEVKLTKEEFDEKFADFVKQRGTFLGDVPPIGGQ
jgi:hypothetical protein